jgi:hypothetical protein
LTLYNKEAIMSIVMITPRKNSKPPHSWKEVLPEFAQLLRDLGSMAVVAVEPQELERLKLALPHAVVEVSQNSVYPLGQTAVRSDIIGKRRPVTYR